MKSWRIDYITSNGYGLYYCQAKTHSQAEKQLFDAVIGSTITKIEDATKQLIGPWTFPSNLFKEAA